MSEDLIPVHFVVLEKIALEGGKKGVRIVPLGKFTGIGQQDDVTSFFEDRKYVIGCVYNGKAKINDNGQIVRLNSQSTFERQIGGDWEVQRLAEKVMDEEKAAKLAENRVRKAGGDRLERHIAALGEYVSKLPINQRYAASGALASMILAASRR